MLIECVVNNPTNLTDCKGLFHHFWPDIFLPPWGVCSPFPFRVTVFVDGIEMPRSWFCPIVPRRPLVF